MRTAFTLSLLLCFILCTASPPMAQEQKPLMHHGADCPQKCKSCQSALSKSLDWLQKKQNPDGTWSGGAGGESWNTFMACEAFLASGSTPSQGPYAAALKKAIAEKPAFPYHPTRWDGATDKGASNWHLAIYAFLMGELMQADPSMKLQDRAGDYLKKIKEYQIPRGGWGHHPATPKELEAEKKFENYPADLLALTNLTLSALISLKKSGMAVEDALISKGLDSVGLAQHDNGGIAYSSRLKVAEEAGRTAGTVYVLNQLNKRDSGMARKAIEYLRPRLKEVPHGHGAVATMHLYFGALSSYHLGREDWNQFTRALFTEWLTEQKADGSFALRKDSELIEFTTDRKLDQPSPAITALAAFVLQIPLEKAPSIRVKK